MIWNIKVWQTCKKIKNQEGGQHFFHTTVHSLRIMKIKKYFFSTLVCIYLFIFGWGSGVEYGHFFFSTLSIDCISNAR